MSRHIAQRLGGKSLERPYFMFQSFIDQLAQYF
jgi:hypothetical protein